MNDCEKKCVGLGLEDENLAGVPSLSSPQKALLEVKAKLLGSAL